MEEKNTNKSEAALREEKILEFWRERKIFEKSLEKNSPKGGFVFYDGPVTANSKPVLHTMVPFSFKDVIPRYRTMRGYHVRRKGGWDTHGLPVELQVEKKLGLNSKRAIEEYGIAKFNQECRQSVWEYVEFWKAFTERMGYWADQENAYVTYHNDYIESLWNVVKKVNDRKLLYKDYKVVPWCPRCGTALSSHELAQGYETVKDLSVYVKFRVLGQDNTYILAWTTTPWTLPGNVALAVGEDIDYVKVKSGGELLILAEARMAILEGEYEVLEKIKGRDLIGLEYDPLFPFIKNANPENIGNAYKVYAADFVNTEDGTGIVHTAVMYGQDDFVLGTKVGLPKYHTVDLEGKFVKGTEFLEGRFVKEEDDNGKPTLAVDIVNYLTGKNLFFKKENYEHSYPHCWRCKTALIYYARDSWYIRISEPEVKAKLISENQKINWEPSHIRQGRFGEWLREIKDWAISRERYWGTPLPVWQCGSCEKREVVGSIAELKDKSVKSGNKYFVMRHGGTEGNQTGVVSYKNQLEDDLTKAGEEETRKSVLALKDKNIDLIITSPFTRTRETTEIVRAALGISKDNVIEEYDLREVDPGKFDGQSWKEYHEHVYNVGPEWFKQKIGGGESLYDVKVRTGRVLYALEEKYKGKNILIITHGGPAWLLYVNAGLFTPENKEYVPENHHVFVPHFKKFGNAEVRALDFVPMPHDESYDLDLHRPYIDQVALICDCGGRMNRVREVMDVWFDSGAMPFAQDHYPFDAGESKGMLYPADFISEGIDQTRGWFYTLHAVGVLMDRGLSYKNVICLGHLLDANGKKMSKSIGNVVDPWAMADKYGVDTLRLWMYSVNQPGESKNFDEKTVALLHSQVFGLLYNVLFFYELYRDEGLEDNVRPKSQNVLDIWTLAKLDELVELMTKYLDDYKLLEPTRAVRDFIGDLSTWYLRRSRERIKEEDANPIPEQAQYGARQTLYFVLKTLARLLAPLAPFAAEDIWLRLRNQSDPESVHLESWPQKDTVGKIKFIFEKGRIKKVVLNMKTVREIVSLGLKERQMKNLPVKQPLQKIKIKFVFPKGFQSLIKEELNIKEIQEEKGLGTELLLDTALTPALRAEGEYREFMRELQDQRKQLGLMPGDRMPMTVEAIYKKYKIMPTLGLHMLRVAASAKLICDNFIEPLSEEVKDTIISACLLHDMGNILKFQLDYFPGFVEPEGLGYWEGVKSEYSEKYGADEHLASLQIAKEVSEKSRVVELIEGISFLGASQTALGEDFDEKIAEYCDDRVNPFGLVSLEQRFLDLRKRYGGRGGDTPERLAFEEALRKIETQIFAKCKIKPEDINDQTIAPLIEELKKFVIE